MCASAKWEGVRGQFIACVVMGCSTDVQWVMTRLMVLWFPNRMVCCQASCWGATECDWTCGVVR